MTLIKLYGINFVFFLEKDDYFLYKKGTKFTFYFKKKQINVKNMSGRKISTLALEESPGVTHQGFTAATVLFYRSDYF